MAKVVKKTTKAKKAAPKKRAKASAKALPLFTIGYEQAKPAAVLDELKQAKINLLVDVRAVAASRRPGFSKKQLAAGLDEAGIGYLHLQPLGTPESGREAARAGKVDTLFRIYDRHLRTKAAQHSLGELADLVKARKPLLALLCYCRNPNTCHRSRIVAALEKKMPLAVDDLVPPPA